MDFYMKDNLIFGIDLITCLILILEKRSFWPSYDWRLLIKMKFATCEDNLVHHNKCVPSEPFWYLELALLLRHRSKAHWCNPQRLLLVRSLSPSLHPTHPLELIHITFSTFTMLRLSQLSSLLITFTMVLAKFSLLFFSFGCRVYLTLYRTHKMCFLPDN